MDSTNRKASRPKIAITMGDPNGIGPEIAVKAAVELADEIDAVLVGPRTAFIAHAEKAGISLPAVPMILPEHGSGESGRDIPFGGIAFGLIADEAGRQSMEAVRTAVTMCLRGDADAMVTAPISKEAIAKAGYPFPGHTEFIAHLCDSSQELMLMVAGSLRVALATIHIPLRIVSNSLSQALLGNRLRILSQSLRTDFDIHQPRIAVLGLNPHAGDGGVIGDEEEAVIRPVIQLLKDEGLFIDGPWPADGFFGNRQYEQYDAVMAMYHDQGLVPFKTLSFNKGCNFTAGLPVIRTSPDHGTAFDIAGRGVASAESMVVAVRVACQVWNSRGRHGVPNDARGSDAVARKNL